MRTVRGEEGFPGLALSFSPESSNAETRRGECPVADPGGGQRRREKEGEVMNQGQPDRQRWTEGGELGNKRVEG